jgi:hypothetical protein
MSVRQESWRRRIDDSQVSVGKAQVEESAQSFGKVERGNLLTGFAFCVQLDVFFENSSFPYGRSPLEASPSTISAKRSPPSCVSGSSNGLMFS